jgi:CBS domain-containing protein
MHTVKDLMKTRKGEVYSINSSQTIYQALLLLAEKNVGALPVLEEHRLVGVISERDYARKVILKGASSLDTMVKKIMTERLISVSPETSLDECLQIMNRHHVRHLPVIENENLVDFISTGDLVNQILKNKDRLISELSSGESG